MSDDATFRSYRADDHEDVRGVVVPSYLHVTDSPNTTDNGFLRARRRHVHAAGGMRAGGVCLSAALSPPCCHHAVGDRARGAAESVGIGGGVKQLNRHAATSGIYLPHARATRAKARDGPCGECFACMWIKGKCTRRPWASIDQEALNGWWSARSIRLACVWRVVPFGQRTPFPSLPLSLPAFPSSA